MLQCLLGRIGSALKAPPDSLDLHVFLDAGGRATNRRVWGGLAAVGDDELRWIGHEVARLGRDCPHVVTPAGEVKGKHLQLEEAIALGNRIREEGRRIVFWANWYPDPSNEDVTRLREYLRSTLASLRPARHRLDARIVEAWHRRMEVYYRRLKPENQHKLLSAITHLQWLFEELARRCTAGQLQRCHLLMDDENLPDPDGASLLLKSFLAAGLRAAGMSCRRTGTAYRESALEGAVTVEGNVDSCDAPGMQYLDVLLQVVQRQLPGYGGPARRRNLGTSRDGQAPEL